MRLRAEERRVKLRYLMAEQAVVMQVDDFTTAQDLVVLCQILGGYLVKTNTLVSK